MAKTTAFPGIPSFDRLDPPQALAYRDVSGPRGILILGGAAWERSCGSFDSRGGVDQHRAGKPKCGRATVDHAARRQGLHHLAVGRSGDPGGFWVRMGLSGAGIAPAGVQKANTGHHHLLVDADLPPLDQPIPNDHNHLHFGLGQTEARLDLPPGKHTLQLLLGDENHVPHQPPLYSKRITITVAQ